MCRSRLPLARNSRRARMEPADGDRYRPFERLHTLRYLQPRQSQTRRGKQAAFCAAFVWPTVARMLEGADDGVASARDIDSTAPEVRATPASGSTSLRMYSSVGPATRSSLCAPRHAQHRDKPSIWCGKAARFVCRDRAIVVLPGSPPLGSSPQRTSAEVRLAHLAAVSELGGRSARDHPALGQDI